MILGLDTATEILHLALVDRERAWTKRVEVGVGRSHSGALLPALSALMEEAGSTGAELRGVCCCAGPGGFTSLRIGVATAEGLALTGLPTWGFSSLRLRAWALREAGIRGRAWVLLDGQRNEVFAQLWAGPEALGEARKLPLASLPALLQNEAWWAPASFVRKLSEQLPPPIPMPEEDAATLAALVALCRELPRLEPEVPIHPFYLRETDAELNFPAESAHLSDALRKGLAR